MKKFLLFLSVIVSITVVFGQDGNSQGTENAWYETGEPMDIDSNEITLNSGKVYFQLNTDQNPKKLKALGFTWREYKSKDYFTGYLVNMTDSTFKASRQDGSLMMIQEALDENGNWEPIEYWTYSGCGNSYFDPLRLKSGKCALVPIRKYPGEFKTKFRLKCKNGNDVFYSDSFEGTMNKSQFNKEIKDVNGILYHGPASYLEIEGE